MKDTIVLYPSPGIGHLVSMVELGKLILNHYSDTFSITILITTTPFHPPSNTSPYITRISKTTPSIHFHHLPTTTSTTTSSDGPPPIFEIFRLNNPLVHQALQSISLTSTVRSFILDFFCAVSLEVTSQLQIPSYFFFTSGASSMAFLLYYPVIVPQITPDDLENPNRTLFHVPGFPPVRASDMPAPTLPNDKSHKTFMDLAQSLVRAKGIIVNSFEYLEERGIRAIRDGVCVPNSPCPPLYCVGPLIAEPASTAGDDASTHVPPHECLTWLESQPSRSVVFLCFGSGGVFSVEQLKEIASGLEKSGQRFLWVVRNAPPKQDSENKRNLADPAHDFELGDLLPEGFLDRTRERGLVLKNWAPQVDVLSRESVGGFVTHSGWNSILESVCAGVPMVSWPLYAEQRLNRVLLVEELRLALPMVESEGGLVSSDEVERRVRMLMESEEGRELRDRVLRVRDKAKAALSEGGSSLLELAELVESWKEGSD